jgi:PPOX class probable F420-dependent enzyme
MAPRATLEELPGWAYGLLREGRRGHLGLLDPDGGPRVLPVTYVVLDGAVWSAVDHKPKRVEGDELARVRWLRAEPRSAFSVDRYDEDWERLAWVQVLGTTSVLEADTYPAAIDALAERYPQYRDRRPAGPLLRLTPERALCWRAD